MAPPCWVPDEIRRMRDDECLLLMRSEDPVIDRKYNLLKHPNVKYTPDAGGEPYVMPPDYMGDAATITMDAVAAATAPEITQVLADNLAQRFRPGIARDVVDAPNHAVGALHQRVADNRREHDAVRHRVQCDNHDAVGVHEFVRPLVIALTRDADQGAGVLYIYGNYNGDIFTFRPAADEVEMEDDIETAEVLGADDVASAGPSAPGEKSTRRGVAGIFFVYKCAGAAADKMLSLEEVKRVADKANNNVRTMGVALSPCTVPRVGGFIIPNIRD